MENKEELKSAQKLLMALFCSVIALALLLVILFETETLPTGVVATEEQANFVLTTLMELLTLALIPLSLRLFKFQKVSNELKVKGGEALRKWGILRLAMLQFPMVFNTLLYYAFMNTTYGYMAIIVLLCMPFVYPSMNRCISELK